MNTMKASKFLWVLFLVPWTFLSANGGEWEDYLNSPYQDFRWNWLIRDGHLTYGQNKYNEALSIYQEAMEKGCKDPLMLFRMGYSYRALRKGKDAAKYFAASKEGLAKAYPKHRYNWLSRYYLAELFLERKATPSAVTELQEAIKLNPKFVQAYLLYGNVYYGQGKYDLAAEKYLRASEISPKSVQALINLGAAYAASGKFDEALATYLKAKDLSPHDVRISLAAAGACLKLQKPSDALTEYENVLKIEPNSERALVGAGNAAWQTGDNKKATEYYQRALGVNLTSHEALMGLGLVMLKTDYEELEKLGLVKSKEEQFEKARDYFQASLKAKPESKEAHYNLGVLYDSQGDFDNAIKQYVQVIEIDPDDESCYYNIGLAFIKARLYEQARTYLNQAVEKFGKESKWSKANLKLLELIDKIEAGKEAEVEKELDNVINETEASEAK